MECPRYLYSCLLHVWYIPPYTYESSFWRLEAAEIFIEISFWVKLLAPHICRDVVTHAKYFQPSDCILDHTQISFVHTQESTWEVNSKVPTPMGLFVKSHPVGDSSLAVFFFRPCEVRAELGAKRQLMSSVAIAISTWRKAFWPLQMDAGKCLFWSFSANGAGRFFAVASDPPRSSVN